MERKDTIQKMKGCMRWYGPRDAVSLQAIRQAGVEGIVTALHQIPVGAVWSVEAIRERQTDIRQHGLEWEVVESLPVHEHIKQGVSDIGPLIENYKQSLRNLGACGIHVVTYNFMPVLDWVRTDLQYRNPDTTLTLRFDRTAFAYFDLYLLKRPGAESDYSPSVLEAAKSMRNSLSADQAENLRRAVLQGLPGSDEHFTEAALLELLSEYDHISASRLREHLISFLKEVVPVAAEAGVVLAIHPDDPPYPLLGLPRVVSTAEDLEALFSAVPALENGLCFCTGALGAGPDNRLLEILDAFKGRIHFLHLRNILHEREGVFRESPHLEGHVPMESVVMAVLRQMQQLGKRLPMRPDHGVLYEMELASAAFPGYSFIGRLKGLAELRGLEQGLIGQL
jgi:mannonate dehydratase